MRVKIVEEGDVDVVERGCARGRGDVDDGVVGGAGGGAVVGDGGFRIPIVGGSP